jgi:ketosteroid isomerase-like protein
MSQEHVELLRTAYAEIARGNYARFRELLDPGVVYWLRPEDPEPGPHRGRDEVLGLLGQPVEDDEFVDLHTEAHQIIDAGECVVVSLRASGRGKASGAPFTTHASVVHRFDGGRVVEMRDYADHAEALQAVGLSE